MVTKFCRVFLLICVPVFVILIDFCWNFNKVIDEKVEPTYIAHGGGNFNGYSYTNSIEAIENSYKNGIRHIELDMHRTSDNKIICIHDWRSFKEKALGGICDDTPISMDSCIKLRQIIYEKLRFRVALMDDVCRLMESHKDLYLVIDKISDPKIIDYYLGKFKSRILVECFSYSDYYDLQEMGYFKPMVSTASTNKDYIRQRLNVLRNGHFLFPTTYVSSKNIFLKQKDNNFSTRSPKCCYAIYSCKNRDEADELFKAYPEIKYIYIDEVK